MRVFDHDLREVFLSAIDLSYVPSKARRLVLEQSIAPYLDDKVQGQLRAIAVCLHKHQNLMPWTEPGVCRIPRTASCTLLTYLAGSDRQERSGKQVQFGKEEQFGPPRVWTLVPAVCQDPTSCGRRADGQAIDE